VNSTQRFYLRIAGITGCLAVIIGAFGAHGLEEILSEDMLEIYETGVKYHFYHALALMALSLAPTTIWTQQSTVWAARMFILGILIFSGSLYTLAITEIRWLGAITPLGGVAMIAGWICLAFSAKPASDRG